jgi:hypothetical protein
MTAAAAAARAEAAKTLLIIAPHFPPATLAAVHRPRHLAKWLPTHGWTPVIIRVDERHYTETLDPHLAELVPQSVIQERVGALKASLTRKLGIADVSLRSYPAMRAAVARAVERYRPRVVLITGSPYYPMLMSGWIKRRFGVRVVLDFQDPWVSAWGATLPKWSKGGISHRLAMALEPRALRHADYVTSVSERQNEEMAARYPWLDATRMADIPIGGDPEDFDALADERGETASADGGYIVYVGSMWPKAEPVVDRLVAAIAAYGAGGGRIPIRFVGTDPRLNDAPQAQLAHLFAKHGTGSIAMEEAGRVPFVEALSIMKKARALILFGSDESHYTASKIYPALMSGRPYLSLFRADSSAHRTLSAAGGGIAIGFRSLEHLDEIVPEIASALERLAKHAQPFPRADPTSYAEFTAAAVSRRYAQIFDIIA